MKRSVGIIVLLSQLAVHCKVSLCVVKAEQFWLPSYSDLSISEGAETPTTVLYHTDNAARKERALNN